MGWAGPLGGKVKRIQYFSLETYKKKSSKRREIDVDCKAMMVAVVRIAIQFSSLLLMCRVNSCKAIIIVIISGS
jgi:hypothetical protein